mmetsp:Transcript_22377/g.33490  ORF Transcript_22377/g.33490 Transcript_22377/m.33490 type:complete len:361 (+) Transcript_22377:115-1197(+)
MAAVLCKGCADACDGCCKLLSLPCKLCGNCCSALTEGIMSLCNNPFCLYVAVAVGFNVPSISCGVSSLVYGLGCAASLWQFVNIILCAINIVAAFYIAIRFNQLRNNPENSDGTRNTRTSGISKASEILCYDPFVAIYILVLIGFFAWLCIGVSWRASGAMNCADDNTLALVGTSLGMGYGFFTAGFFALSCSVCCSCCCNDERRGSNPYYSQQQYGRHAASNSRPPQSSSNNNSRPPSSTYPAQNYSATVNNDVEYAAATPVAATPVQDKYSNTPVNAEPIAATVVSPSAPPLSADDDDDSLNAEASAAASGSKMGTKIGSLFGASDQTKAKLETTGAKASIAMNKGFRKAQNLLAGKK